MQRLKYLFTLNIKPAAFAPRATVTDENGKTWYFAKYDDIVL